MPSAGVLIRASAERVQGICCSLALWTQLLMQILVCKWECTACTVTVLRLFAIPKGTCCTESQSTLISWPQWRRKLAVIAAQVVPLRAVRSQGAALASKTERCTLFWLCNRENLTLPVALVMLGLEELLQKYS